MSVSLIMLCKPHEGHNHSHAVFCRVQSLQYNAKHITDAQLSICRIMKSLVLGGNEVHAIAMIRVLGSGNLANYFMRQMC